MIYAVLHACCSIHRWPAQDDRFGAGRAANESAPFPLKELPRAMGDWAATSDADGVLDPEVARIAGSSDHLIRTYVHQATGTGVTLLILFGPAQVVALHSADVCYPAIGYTPVGGYFWAMVS